MKIRESLIHRIIRRISFHRLGENEHKKLGRLVRDRDVVWNVHPRWNTAASKMFYDSYHSRYGSFILIKTVSQKYLGRKVEPGSDEYIFYDKSERRYSERQMAEAIGMPHQKFKERILQTAKTPGI